MARLVPTQQRSRERFERILECAAEVMAEKGSEAFRMSDIVERTGVGFGSLYQYFPDKTAIIGTLAERYNAIGRDCVRARPVDDDKRKRTCIRRSAASPTATTRCSSTSRLMRDIWQATQADRALQKLDEEDGAYLSGLFLDALRRIAPKAPEPALSAFSQLTMTLIAAAVRHAITLDARAAKRLLALFKALLPRDLSALTRVQA